jgi:hypothetical protein
VSGREGKGRDGMIVNVLKLVDKLSNEIVERSVIRGILENVH